MPVNSKVHKMYQHLLSTGYSKEQAAKMAQAKTGLALRTGKPIKAKRNRKLRKIKGIYG